MHKFVPWLLIGALFCGVVGFTLQLVGLDNDDLGVIMYAGELILSIIVIVFLMMVFIKD